MVSIVLALLLGLAPQSATRTRDRVPRPFAPRTTPPPSHADTEIFGGLQLERTHDGGFHHRDDRNRFEATIAPDGTVSFAVPAATSMHVCFVGYCVSTALDEPDEHARARAQGAPAADRAAASMDVPNIFGGAGGLVQGGIRFGFQTKVPEYAKKEFLRRTLAMRARLAETWLRARIVQQLGKLRTRLVEVWYDRATPARDRRKRLFELWDECAEGIGPAPGELPADVGQRVQEDRKRAGIQARGQIEAFVRRHLGTLSPHRYSATELQMLNRGRTSAHRFDPYRE